ncbi:MAG: CHAT domain-containing protein [Acidobacteria bacterium]|nr:CHAT domain-containing protein [Acidobacteriota bacterium]
MVTWQIHVPRRIGIVAWAMLSGAFVAALTAGCPRTPGDPAGAVIVRSEPGWAGALSGLEPGDTVVEWRRGELRGNITSPFDLVRVEQEQAPLGTVELLVRRSWSWSRTLSMAPGFWRVEARPVLGAKRLARHQQALRHAEAGELLAAATAWRSLASELFRSGRPGAAAWCHLQAGVALARDGKPGARERELQAGAALMNGPASRAAYWEQAGSILLEEPRRRKAAAGAFTTALGIRRREAPRSAAVAFDLIGLCRTSRRTHGEEAREALPIYREVAGEGMETSSALYELALSGFMNGRFEGAVEHCRKALAVVERLAPRSALRVALLGRLGVALHRLGEYDAARKAFEEELEVAMGIDPEGPLSAYACNHMGLVAKVLGQYQEASSWYLRGLEIYRGCRPGGVEVAGMLNNLGNVAMRRDDLATALRYHREALAIRERLHPGGSDVAASLNNIGSIERQMGEMDAAREHLAKALAIKRNRAPDTSTLANTLIELGSTAALQRRFAEARRLYQEARKIKERVAPGGRRLADILFLQGSVAKEEGRLAECERLWRQAITVAEGGEEGLELSEHELSRFGARFYQFYGSLARLLAKQGRAAEAFGVAERARARALRSMLLGAQSIPAGVPGRVWWSYRRVLRELDRARTEHARQATRKGHPGGASALTVRIQELVARRDLLAQRIVATAPRLARLRTISTPTAQELGKTMDPGTVLLSYTVGEHETLLFVLAAGGPDLRLRTLTIPVGSAELERRVSILRAFIARGRLSSTLDHAFLVQGRKLFELLVAPVLTEIESARRLLIVPDGPLFQAPFAALVLPGEPLRFLGVWKPLFFDASAGALVALRARDGKRRRGTGMVAFGDPLYPPGCPTVQALHLQPLEGSRTEVGMIAARFGGQAQLFLGRAASEQGLRSLRTRARYLHLAVHARSDPRFPLESALFLTIPPSGEHSAEDDGVLHAWEIMDGLHLDVEIVTLSGCSTGCGERIAGEGILGLARAFQHAGARTVVASQWPVADRSTSELMDRFYAGLASGLSTAEALQAARRAFAHAPIRLQDGNVMDVRHPFHWAAFQVIGDWR